MPDILSQDEIDALLTATGTEEDDILRLETSVKQDAVVFVGDRPKFLGRPGLMGKRRAIQLTEAIVKEDETNYMTDVQRTETYVL
jgi:flagellar motor switch protein FliM